MKFFLVDLKQEQYKKIKSLRISKNIKDYLIKNEKDQQRKRQTTEQVLKNFDFIKC